MPPGKHALITVKQPKGNLVWIQTPTIAVPANAKKNDKEKSPLHISTWDECDTLQVNPYEHIHSYFHIHSYEIHGTRITEYEYLYIYDI